MELWSQMILTVIVRNAIWDRDSEFLSELQKITWPFLSLSSSSSSTKSIIYRSSLNGQATGVQQDHMAAGKRSPPLCEKSES